MKTEKISLKQISIIFILNLFVKISSQQVLVPNPINYWSFTGDYTDSNGGANLLTGTGSNSVSFGLGPDRFGNPNSSLYLKNGWVQIPPGIYISGPNFTISHWIYSISSGDFIPIQFSLNGNQYIGTQVSGLNFFANGNSGMACSRTLPLNAWYHLAYAYYPNNTMTLFINGSYACSKDNCNPPGININRTTNYIGANPQGTSVFLNGYIDEIKIYNVGLTSDQMLTEFSNALKPQIPTTILSTTTTTTKAIPAQLPNPVNYWSFTGDYTDSNGGANLLTGTGSNSVSFGLGPDRFGNPNSSLYLKNGWVQIPPGIYISGPNFTISHWINSISSGDFVPISFSNCNLNDYISTQVAGLNLWGNQFGGPSGSSRMFCSQKISLNVWNHLAYVYYPNNTMTLFINGTYACSKDNSSPPGNNINRTTNYIGANCPPSQTTVLLNGYIDEIKIYNVGLTSDQMLTEFSNALKPQIPTTILSTTTTTTKAIPAQLPNPVNYWSFTGDYTDSNGGANLLTGTGSNSVSFGLGPDRFGNPNSSLYLKNGWVQIPPGIYISGPNFTISHWINSISSGDFVPISFSNCNLNDYISTQVAGLNLWGNQFGGPSGSSRMFCSQKISLNVWNHLAYVYYPNNTMTLFINGTYACSKDNSSPPGNNINRTTNYIGANCPPSQTTVLLNGYIDEIKIYNVGLTSDQMLTEFSNAMKSPTPTTTTTTTTTKIATISSASNSVKLLTPPIDLDLNFIHPVNYWSFDNSLSDSISGSLLYGGLNYNFVDDHLNNPLKAIRFNHGFLQMPAGDYFLNNKFTITAWVNYVSFESNDLITLIDFGNPNQNDNIILSIVPVSNQMSAIIFSK
jgi:hypothetical protein